MLSDILIEDIFEVKMTVKDMLIRSICVAIWPASILVTFMIPFAGILFLGIAAIMWFLVKPTTNVEYEYSYLNGELSIDIIYSKMRRKKWVTYDLRSAELVAPADSDSIKRHMHGKVITDYSSGFESDDEKTGIVLKGHKGAELILLKKNNRIINAIRDIKPMIVEYKVEDTTD